MASKVFSEKWTRGYGRVDYDLSFSPNGTGAPSVLTGVGYTVTRTAVGTFAVVFKEAFVELVACDLALQLAAFANSNVILGPWVPSTRTLTVFVNTAGVLADIAAAANNAIHLSVTFRNSKLKNG